MPLAAGAALLGWALAEHYAAAPDKSWAVKRTLEPEYLLSGGPYRLSRNPMHVGGVAIWSGWAAWFGSAPVAAGVLGLAGIYRAGIVWEERMLERRWGDEWRTYARQTSRWLPLGPHRVHGGTDGRPASACADAGPLPTRRPTLR